MLYLLKVQNVFGCCLKEVCGLTWWDLGLALGRPVALLLGVLFTGRRRPSPVEKAKFGEAGVKMAAELAGNTQFTRALLTSGTRQTITSARLATNVPRSIFLSDCQQPSKEQAYIPVVGVEESGYNCTGTVTGEISAGGQIPTAGW